MSHKFALFLCYARVAAAAAARVVAVVVAVCLHFVKFVTFAWGAVAVADSACMCLQHALIVALPIAKARNNSNNSNKSEANRVAAVGNSWNANSPI